VTTAPVFFARIAERGMPPRGVFASGVRNALKNKEIGKTPEPSVRKRIEGKDLAEFFGQKRSGRENGGMPEGLQEAVLLTHK